MDAKSRERGILKMDSRSKVQEARMELTPQVSRERSPASPQPSVDRLSVTWADPDPCSMLSSAARLPEPAAEVKFSTTGDASEDEDYSASLSAVLRQRRASVRRSRKGRARRPSSPFLQDEPRARRRSSVFTTSSGDTAISMEESQPAVSQEQIFENIHLHKEVLGSVKQQPLGMSRKLKLVHQAKAYIKRHEGQLQERLAQSKSTRDIYARFNILLNTRWQQMKREAANTSNLLIPWESRIKEIESHFGSVVASYFTFLRWLFWVNLVVAFILLVFVIVPEYLTANPEQDGERKLLMEDEKRNASNLLTLWEFEGILKLSPIFYGYYSNVVSPKYWMPMAYFLTGLVVYIYSFVAILRKMAENSRMSKLSEKEDECIFSWKLFTGWDYMIGNAETAHNRIASVILGFKEALLEEAEKKKDLRNWRIISLRALVNILVLILLVVSAYAVVTVVSKTDDPSNQYSNWWRENQTTIVVTIISITFPVLFELLGLLEHYHPRKQLRLQLARIMLLNLLNLYSLIFAQFSKIEGMSKDLDALKPTVVMKGGELMQLNDIMPHVPMECFEVVVNCTPCNINLTTFPVHATIVDQSEFETIRVEVDGSMVTSSEPEQVVTTKPKQLNTEQITSGTTLSTITTQPPTSDKLLPANLEASTDNITNGNESLVENGTRKDVYYELVDSVELDSSTLSVSNTSSNSFLTTTEDPVQRQIKILYDKYFVNNTDFPESNEDDDGPPFYYDSSNETDVRNEQIDDKIFKETTSSIDNLTSVSSETEHSRTNSLFISDVNLTETTTKIPIDYSFSTLNISDDVSLNETDNSTDYDLTHFFLNETDNATKVESSLTDLAINMFHQIILFYLSSNSSNESSLGNDNISPNVTYNTTTENEQAVTIDGVDIGLNTNVSTNSSLNNTDTGEVLTSYTSTGDIVTVPTVIKVNKTTNNVTNSTISSITELSTIVTPKMITFNNTINCNGTLETQMFFISNCKLVEKRCYQKKCNISHMINTTVDIMHLDGSTDRQTYNLTIGTKKKLRKLCWETMFGQELVKLTMMDLVFVLLGTLFMDFFRALFVRYMNRCWCWDLEKKFPEYGDFKIAENILHLINNQGMVWMGMFFSPGLVVLNVSKLMIMMYLRSWAVMTCNVPHEVVFRVSKSNNFYLSLLLTMLFLCVLPVGYTIVWVKPSWHCGPFSGQDKIYQILTDNLLKILPNELKFALAYIASPAIVIPLLVLLVLIIYYLLSLANSLREANNDLKIQLRRERTEERRKMFQLADTRRAGSSALDNTPFARWKKALPALPMKQSVDSDDRRTTTDEVEPVRAAKKRGGLLAKIVGLAVDKKTEEQVSDEAPPSPNNGDDTDTDFHEALPKEVLKIKDIFIVKKRNSVEFKPENVKDNLKVKLDSDRSEKRPERASDIPPIVEDTQTEPHLQRNETADSNTSKQSDSFGSVIPVITISTTESDDEVLSKETRCKEGKGCNSKKRSSGLRRQSSVDSGNDHKVPKEKREDVQKYQHTL